jgi:hypothetical protein
MSLLQAVNLKKASIYEELFFKKKVFSVLVKFFGCVLSIYENKKK